MRTTPDVASMPTTSSTATSNRMSEGSQRTDRTALLPLRAGKSRTRSTSPVATSTIRTSPAAESGTASWVESGEKAGPSAGTMSLATVTRSPFGSPS